MRFFEDPIVEINRFEMEDVITTSGASMPSFASLDANAGAEDIFVYDK